MNKLCWMVWSCADKILSHLKGVRILGWGYKIKRQLKPDMERVGA